MQEAFVIGVDFGTDSVRSIIVNAHNGAELASAVYYYPRWKDGLYCNPSQNIFRQHPLDYLEGLEHTIKECIKSAGATVAKNIKAISVDTTGSSPVAVDKSGTALALLPGFETNPNAMFVLWKDHSSVNEAAELNRHATKYATNYLQFVGGIYSSEWFWAKLLHILRVDEAVRKECYSWVEHCDWIPFVLCGGNDIAAMKRGVCSAGHKALWAKEYGGLPPDSFFADWDPLLEGFTSRLFTDTFTADKPAGIISPAWSQKLGLPQNTVIGVGAFDAHMGAVGGQIEAYHLSKVMGTSTCDMLVAPTAETAGKLIKGICGQVPGSVIPGMMGMEAGQSAFGDTFAWWRNILSRPAQQILSQTKLVDAATAAALAAEINDKLLAELSKKAATMPLEENGELSTDWLNGRRTPDANQLLKSGITGLNLGTDAVKIFRSLVEGTCFGAKAIVDRFNVEGIPVKGLIGLGGVAKKSPYIIQMMANIMQMPIRIHKSEQTCALGAAMFAATAAGIYNKVEEAMQAMGQGFDAEYKPDISTALFYENRYNNYIKLGNFIESQLQD